LFDRNTPGIPMPKAMINRPNTVKSLNPDNPNKRF
jgi:hypothetical protein